MFTPDMTIRYKYSMPSCVAYNHTMQLEQHAMNAAIQSVRSGQPGAQTGRKQIVCCLYGMHCIFLAWQACQGLRFRS